jgi:3-hydroxyanthranilate 3,4-dioxygenase
MQSDTPRGTPIDLRGWIADNASSFEPPVSNKVVWRDSDHIFMVIRGPNARSDFHIDPFDEVFMQLEGAIRVDLMVDGTRQQRWINEGEIMLVPGNVPHSPLRPPNTWGVVIERPRHGDELDSLVWFCDVCDAEIRRVSFLVRDIEVELAAALRAYNDDVALRTCPNGHVNPVPEPFDGSPPERS